MHSKTVFSSTKRERGERGDYRGKERKPPPVGLDEEEKSSSSTEGSKPKFRVRTVEAKESGENGGTRWPGSSDSEIDENPSDGSAKHFSSSQENAKEKFEKKPSLSKEDLREALLAAAKSLN